MQPTHARPGRKSNSAQMIEQLGGTIACFGLGKPGHVITENGGDFCGFSFKDNGAQDHKWQTLVWLAPNDTYVVERLKDGETVGLVDDVYFDTVADMAYKATCFLDTPFGDHPGHWADQGVEA